jgi:hypothetical protein
MTKRVMLLACFLGLMSTIPAYASPTNKTITITCVSVSPNVLTGTVAVTVDDGAGNIASCGLQLCDSSGLSTNATNSTSCTPPFRVQNMSYTLTYVDTDGNTNPAGQASESGIALKGKGFSYQIGPTVDPGDTVSFSIK